MIRLAAVRGGESPWRNVASRLRGASIDTTWDSIESGPPISSDAVLLLASMQIPVEFVARCLSAGKHVLLVVDGGLSRDVIETLNATAQGPQSRLAIVNPDRFSPSSQQIRQQIDSNKLGTPGLFRLHRWTPTVNHVAGASQPVPDFLVRDLDLALAFMGQAPNLVYAIERPATGTDQGSGRCIVAHLGFPGGGMALLDYSTGLPPGDDYFSLSLIGSDGAAYADDHQNMQLAYRGGAPQSIRVDERNRQLATLVQEFVAGLQTGQLFPTQPHDWNRVLALADYVQRSIESKQAVRVAG